ncbi:hypothetical protein FQZ97_1144760 [compost metagenome]
MEDVVAEDQAHGVFADKRLADQEGLGQAVRRWLFGIVEAHAELAAIAEHLLELRQVVRGGDDQDVADAGKHQHRNRVVDHRFVVDRQQLLGHAEGDRVQPRTGAAGEDDSFHAECSLSAPRRSRW